MTDKETQEATTPQSPLLCMVFDECGNAVMEAFDYTADELERRAFELRDAEGSVTRVTIGPSPFASLSHGGQSATPAAKHKSGLGG